jgi:hypothetical protein
MITLGVYLLATVIVVRDPFYMGCLHVSNWNYRRIVCYGAIYSVTIAHFPGYQDNQQHHYKNKNGLQHIINYSAEGVQMPNYPGLPLTFQPPLRMIPLLRQEGGG